MAINLHQIHFSDSPLLSLIDAVLLIPTETPLTVQNASLKILYFLEGTTELALDDGSTFVTHPGDTFIVGPCTQRYRALDERQPYIHALIFKFHAQPAPAHGGLAAVFERYLAANFGQNRLVPTGQSAALWDLTVRLRLECEKRQPLYEEASHHLAMEFLLHLTEIAGLQPHRFFWHPKSPLNKGFEALARQFARNAANATPRLPPEFHSSPEIEAALEHDLGIPGSTLLRRMQIESAKAQLVSTTHSIIRVAQRVGLQSLATFYRQFQKFTGVSPRHYKNQYGNPSTVPPAHRRPPFPWRETRYTPGLVHPGRRRMLRFKAPGILFLLEGSLAVQVASRAIRVRREHPLFLPGPEPLAITESSRDCVLLFVGIDAPAVAAAPLLLPPLTPARLGFLQKTAHQPRHDAHEQIALHAFFSLLWLAARRMLESHPDEVIAPEATQPLPIAHAQEYIRKNFRRNIKLREIAWAVGLSEEHLARQFQLVYHETVMNALKRRRLEIAKGLLLSTNLPLEQVAVEAGFTTTGLFFRAFKASEQCTPGAWRLRHTKKECEG